MKIKSRQIVITSALLLTSLGVFSAATRAEHPEVLVTPADRASMQAKVQDAPWARTSYAALKAKIDGYIEKCASDPDWMSSRLCMNWQTHYTVPITKNQKWIGGDGHAPVPTPRFAGERNWATDWGVPADLADVRPNNDDPDGSGKIYLVNNKTKQGAWIDPSETGRTIETINQQIIQAAADAGFLYWMTGDEKYAKFGTNILWTYMHGFSYVQPPTYPASETDTHNIIGMTSFEVIHENVMIPLSDSYDFLYPYMVKQGLDVELVQTQLKRMADRVIEGGFSTGNWNLNQAMMIAYAGLALEDNAHYADHKGRQYYVDVVLNAQLPNQLGITHVIHTGYDQETGLWPEAPGYGFGASWLITQVVSLAAADPAGQAVLRDPFMDKAILAQEELIYPNGFSVGLGDTNNERLNDAALELLIAAARKQGNATMETQLTAALNREIALGYYDRTKQSDTLYALTQFVSRLEPTPPSAIRLPRTFYAHSLNILMQRNLTDIDHSLVCAMYGTNGGHVHSNGLAMELYGAGLIQGADPGRGLSYWTPDHAEYYSQPPAHNTVIVNGKSNYPAYGAGHESMTPDVVEPAFGAPALSPNISFAQSSFQYATPRADQQRTLAVIRTGAGTGAASGFYYDVFRSRAQDDPGQFHDYLYHNIGQSMNVTNADGTLALVATQELGTAHGDLKGYDYFKNERSGDGSKGFHAVFTTTVSGKQSDMAVWMNGGENRTVFAVDAPSDHAARPSLPQEFQNIPMPTLLVRQQGEAWAHPFVAVYSPYLGSEGNGVLSVRPANVSPLDQSSSLAASVVQGHDYSVLLAQDDSGGSVHHVEGKTFEGSFGVVISRKGLVDEVYLGHGHTFGDEKVFVTALDKTPVNADVLRSGDGWVCSSSGAVRVGLPFVVAGHAGSLENWALFVRQGGRDTLVRGAVLTVGTLPDGRRVLWVSVVLPGGGDQQLILRRLLS